MALPTVPVLPSDSCDTNGVIKIAAMYCISSGSAFGPGSSNGPSLYDGAATCNHLKEGERFLVLHECSCAANPHIGQHSYQQHKMLCQTPEEIRTSEALLYHAVVRDGIERAGQKLDEDAATGHIRQVCEGGAHQREGGGKVEGSGGRRGGACLIGSGDRAEEMRVILEGRGVEISLGNPVYECVQCDKQKGRSFLPAISGLEGGRKLHGMRERRTLGGRYF